MGFLDYLKKKGSQIVKPIEQKALNYGTNQLNSFKTQMDTKRNDSSMFSRAQQGLVHGAIDTANTGISALNRAASNPVIAKVRKVASFLPIKNPIVDAGLDAVSTPKAKTFTQNNKKFLEDTAPTTTTGKVFNFSGQNLPYAMVPSLPAVSAAKIASPITRLAANSLLRGTEGAGINAVSGYGEGKSAKEIVKQIPKDIAVGAVINTALSPKQIVKSVKYKSISSKMDAPLSPKYSQDYDQAGNVFAQYYEPRVKTKEMAVKDFVKENFGDSGLDVNNYSMNGKVTAQYDPQSGKLLSWSTDNPLFAKKISAGDLQFGLSTKDVKPSEIGQNSGQNGLNDPTIDSKAISPETRPLLVRTEKKAHPQVVQWPKDAPIPKGSNAKEIPDAMQDLTGISPLKRPDYGSMRPEPQLLNNHAPNDEIKSSFADSVQKNYTDVKDKVNIIDYLRTPDRVLKKIGLGKETEYLRQQFTSYQKQLPEEINKISEWANQVTPEQNRRIFQWLDGQDVQLQGNEIKVGNEVKSYLKEWADKLGLPEDRRISNYITHIFEKDLKGAEFPDELARIIQDKVAGSVYDPFTMERLGKKGYVEDTFRALEAYVKRATRKANLDPALEQIKNSSEHMEVSQFNYVKNFIDRVNLRPTNIDTLIDNAIKSIPFVGYKTGQRPVASISKAGRQWVYRGTLGLNVSSALKNLSQGANTYAKLGEKYTAKGYFDLIKNWKSDELEQVGVLADDLIQDKNLSFAKRFIDKVDKGLFSLFEAAEKINRGAAYYGAKAKFLNQGMSEKEAIEKAVGLVRDTQFKFGSIDTPPVLQSDIGKTLGQFQSFSLKQAEFLTEMVTQKEWAGLARWVGSSLLFVYGIGKLFGMDPKDLIPSFRFGMPPTLEPVVTAGKAALGGKDEYGQPLNYKDVAKSGVKFVPAGVQGKKTAEGLLNINRGYDQTATGKIKYPVSKDPANVLKAILFGKNNLPEAKLYREKKQQPLGEDQSQLFKDLGGNQKAFNLIINKREDDKIKQQDNKDRISKYLSGDQTALSGLDNQRKASLVRSAKEQRAKESLSSLEQKIFDMSQEERKKLLLEMPNLSKTVGKVVAIQNSLSTKKVTLPKLKISKSKSSGKIKKIKIAKSTAPKAKKLKIKKPKIAKIKKSTLKIVRA